jgi:hypothetical protein
LDENGVARLNPDLWGKLARSIAQACPRSVAPRRRVPALRRSVVSMHRAEASVAVTQGMGARRMAISPVTPRRGQAISSDASVPAAVVRITGMKVKAKRLKHPVLPTERVVRDAVRPAVPGPRRHGQAAIASAGKYVHFDRRSNRLANNRPRPNAMTIRDVTIAKAMTGPGSVAPCVRQVPVAESDPGRHLGGHDVTAPKTLAPTYRARLTTGGQGRAAFERMAALEARRPPNGFAGFDPRLTPIWPGLKLVL